MKIYFDCNAMSTAVFATKIKTGLEFDIIAGAKRSLAECLDELHSEVLHDNTYTGNDEGLELARENTNRH